MRPSQSLSAGLAFVAVLLALPAAAAAQNAYADQVQGYLDEFEARVLDQGYTLEGEAVGWMMDGAEGGTIVDLPAGSYVVLGACDDDCSDIDLAVARVDDQADLGADREMDSFPIVEFTLAERGSVLIGITMPECDTARCYAGYRWYSSDVASGLDDVEGWEQQIAVQLEALPVPEDAGVNDERTGLVGAGEATRFSLALEPGPYGGVAVCDFDCSDVDLAVYDARGDLVSDDVLEDDFPIVNFEVAEGGGTFTFEVRMVDCSTDTCGYGFRLYRQQID